MLGFVYDPDRDRHRHRDDVHFRLYFVEHRQELAVICVQWFDYFDYNDSGFLGYDAYDTEAEAEAALRQFKTDLARLPGILPDFLT